MELRDHLRTLALHWLGVLVITLVAVSAAAGYTFTRDKVYAAHSSGFVRIAGNTNAALGSVNDELARSKATSYEVLATDRATAEIAADELQINVSPSELAGRISIEHPEDTVVLNISATGSTPEEAQALADAWASALGKRVAQIEDPQGLARVGTAQVEAVTAAELPSDPISPKPVQNLAIGLLVGLVLGYGYAIARHTLDRRLRTPQAVQDRFQLPVLGTVPIAGALGSDGDSRSQVVLDADGAAPRQRDAAEAFRKIRTNLVFMDVDNPPRIMVVTSPKPGDGKSTVSANLAAAVAVSGQKVALIDGDLRRPTIAKSFGVDDAVGLTDVLVGRVPVADALQLSEKNPQLFVLPAGRIPPNPSELLGSQAMRSLLQELSKDYLVIVDAPPLLPVTDAAILTASSDGALVVVSAGKTLDNELDQALSHLQAVNGRALGVIMNKTSRRVMGGYYYYESSYYGSPSSTQSTPEASPELDSSTR